MQAEENVWRQRYREAITQLEAEEARWRRLEGVLRRVIGRLCLAASHRDPGLDVQLDRLAAAVRQEAGADALESLLPELSEAIAALDRANDLAPQESPPAADSSRAGTEGITRLTAAVGSVLSHLELVPGFAPRTAELRAEIERVADEVQLAGTLERLAVLIDEQCAQMKRERAAMERLLRQLNSRLDEITSFLAGQDAEQQQALDETQRLNRLVMGEVGQITVHIRDADSLAELREQVSMRLEAIDAHLKEFRSREQARMQRYHEHTSRMRLRIAQLERESRALQESLEEEQRMSLVDALTGIANRAAYDERIEQEYERWLRDRKPVSILAWDIDRFKTINDAYGHRAGDKVLRVVGQHLARQVRGTDFVARYGGEEFVMILVGTGPAEALTIADNIRRGIENIGFHFRGTPVTVTASCGITSFREGDTADDAFDRADRALYRAKAEGRNRCVVD